MKSLASIFPFDMAFLKRRRVFRRRGRRLIRRRGRTNFRYKRYRKVVGRARRYRKRYHMSKRAVKRRIYKRMHKAAEYKQYHLFIRSHMQSYLVESQVFCFPALYGIFHPFAAQRKPFG